MSPQLCSPLTPVPPAPRHSPDVLEHVEHLRGQVGVSQVTLCQVSLEHCGRGLLPLQRWCLFLDTQDPGGRRGVQRGAGTDLRSPHSPSPGDTEQGSAHSGPLAKSGHHFSL